MRLHFITALLLVLQVPGHGWAAEKTTSGAKDATFSLAPAETPSNATRFSESQLAYVQSWIRQKAPECPPAASAVVAEEFLDELQQRSPGKLDRLLSEDFPASAFESMLLRQVGLRLSGADQAPVREEVARRRLAAFQVAAGKDSRAAVAEAAGLVAKIKDLSSTQHRRLIEGKMDDDDLEILLRKVAQAGTTAKEAAPAKPKVMTATEIISEFSRRNQVGSALLRLQAYVVEGKLRPAGGEEQELLLFKMRPDRFRLVIRSGGLTRYILAGDGSRFWQQTPGQPTQLVSAQDMGSRLYLSEFADPLFADEGYVFERLPDGVIDGQKTYRISVQRSDKSKFVACLDQEKFQEIARENEDHTHSRYTDFREIGGVTYAFHEETTDDSGRKGVFKLTGVTPNPGLIQDLFELPAQQNRNFFEAERLLVAGRSTP